MGFNKPLLNKELSAEERSMLRRGLFKKGRRKMKNREDALNSDSTEKTDSKDALTSVTDKVLQPFKRKKKKGKSKTENGDPISERTSKTISESGLEVDRRMVSSDETASSKGSEGLPEPISHNEEDNEDPAVIKSYDAVPLLDVAKLPRGGVSMETQAVGRVQVSSRV